jgi:hypothetical protein
VRLKTDAENARLKASRLSPPLSRMALDINQMENGGGEQDFVSWSKPGWRRQRRVTQRLSQSLLAETTQAGRFHPWKESGKWVLAR